MKLLKSHFWYNKSQRNGIFLLVIIILIFQAIIFFTDFSSEGKIDMNSPEVVAFRNQIDSLKRIELEHRKPKRYPFNPNYITDYKGEQLGMSLKEIDRLLTFRKTNKFVNSKEEFQKVTKVSDSLLNKIALYFKFPDWVVERNKNLQSGINTITSKTKKYRGNSYYNTPKHIITSTDINKASQEDFKTIYGVGEKLSERIIKYRSKLQGFSLNSQLFEVWGLKKDVAEKVLKTFKIIEKPIIKKENVNTVTFRQLLKNPYIDYELCKKIFDYRDQVAELQDIKELINIEGFPVDKYDRIVLYLVAE